MWFITAYGSNATAAKAIAKLAQQQGFEVTIAKVSGPSPISMRFNAALMTTRLYRCFESAGIPDWPAVEAYTVTKLMDIRNFGADCLIEVRANLAMRGLHLKGE